MSTQITDVKYKLKAGFVTVYVHFLPQLNGLTCDIDARLCLSRNHRLQAQFARSYGHTLVHDRVFRAAVSDQGRLALFARLGMVALALSLSKA
jgi:hypothetical protein